MASNVRGPALRSISALMSAGTVGSLTDGQLLERFLTQDEDAAELAFATLVDRHGAMVLRVCRAVLRDAHDADDAFQATFLILALKAQSIRGRESLGSWLYSVAYNVAATSRSTAARRRRHEFEAGQTRAHAAVESSLDDVGPIVHQELDRLPERYRTVLVLCYLEGLTHQQAAQQLGWPLGTVQSRLARGRERLRAWLLRRGLAPSVGLGVLSFNVEAATATVPSSLAAATVRLAFTVTAARALASGSIPLAMMTLATSAARTMLITKVMATSVSCVIAMGAIAVSAVVYAYQDGRPEAAAARKDEPIQREHHGPVQAHAGQLTARGLVRLRDGSPVVGATVRLISGIDETGRIVQTDGMGHFELHNVFEGGGCLHISSPDGSYQTIFHVPAVATRTVFADSLELTLLPALSHTVTVLSDRRPAEGVQVAALGTRFHVQGRTGRNGKVRLRLPANERLNELVAWHPTLGTTGKRDLDTLPAEAAAELSLIPPAPHTIRVVDLNGKGIGGLELGVSFFPEAADWIVAKHFDGAHVRTGADGTAIVPWAPRTKLQFVQVDPIGSGWKIDATDLKETAAGVTTVRVRRERAVTGRLIMPDGASAEGILVNGFGHGPTNMGDIPYARARRDGTFTLHVPSDHTYLLGIIDLKWACDPWTGVILHNDDDKPLEITMPVYPATPLVVRVSRGPRHEPVAGAWIDLGVLGKLAQRDGRGFHSFAAGGARSWLRTDRDGIATAAVGKGEHRFTFTSGSWTEERTIKVTSEKPVEVEFYRPWKGEQRVNGRLLQEGAPYDPLPTMVAEIWTPREQRLPLEFKPAIHADGTFEVAFDAESINMLFIDRKQQLSGFLEGVRGDAQVELNLRPTATYAGTLVNDKNEPVADRTLQLHLHSHRPNKFLAARTDKNGHFRIAGLPAKIQLELHMQPVADDPYSFRGEILTLEPGEIRNGQRLELERDRPLK